MGVEVSLGLPRRASGVNRGLMLQRERKLHGLQSSLQNSVYVINTQSLLRSQWLLIQKEGGGRFTLSSSNSALHKCS